MQNEGGKPAQGSFSLSYTGQCRLMPIWPISAIPFDPHLAPNFRSFGLPSQRNDAVTATRGATDGSVTGLGVSSVADRSSKDDFLRRVVEMSHQGLVSCLSLPRIWPELPCETKKPRSQQNPLLNHVEAVSFRTLGQGGKIGYGAHCKCLCKLNMLPSPKKRSTDRIHFRAKCTPKPT